MKTTINYTGTSTPIRLSYEDDGTNRVFINEDGTVTQITGSDLVGTGSYTCTVGSLTITIYQISDMSSGNVALEHVTGLIYQLVEIEDSNVNLYDKEAEFYILNTSFQKVHALTQYESLMWVDKYDEPGTIEIYAPPTTEIKEYAVIGNYIMSTKSEHLMIIEKLTTTYSSSDGIRLIIEGRSLESILDRRVIFLQLYLRDKETASETYAADNLEDAVRQILDYTIISPDNSDRQISNFTFCYSHDTVIAATELEDMEFEKGTNVLNIIETIVKSKNLGFKITLNSSNQFVFRIINGLDRTSSQNTNGLVEFSPTFNNIKNTKFIKDAGENFKNYIYTEGEVYNDAAPTIIETGDATGLDRREYYMTSDSQHESESSNVTHTGIYKTTTTLSDDEYTQVLEEEGTKAFNSYGVKTTMESEVEPKLQFVYGKDFFIGDIVQIKDATGNSSSSRVTEFIISHSTSGYEEYPTFTSTEETSESPSQSSATGGDYTETNVRSILKAEAVVSKTGTTSVSQIAIPDSLNYMTGDALIIDISGLTLAYGSSYDYTISGNYVVLTTPLTHAAKIHFIRLRFI